MKLLLSYKGEVVAYKSTHEPFNLPPQLFNLKDDPYENKNLYSENFD